MDERSVRAIQACTQGSIDDTMTFPEVVAQLAEIGCEQYHADFRRHEKTYYMAEGETRTEPLPTAAVTIGQDFDEYGIRAALRATQNGEINYLAFLDRITRAGCVGYFVYITGKRALYLGRSGDFYVEHFPPRRTAASPASPTS